MSNSFSIQQGLHKIIGGSDLTREEAAALMAQIMEGQATGAQFGSLVTALRMKGETIEEVTGFAETMRRYASRVTTEQSNLLDTCGTGGDGAHTFNISTASAIVAAAGGIRVAKHGNRAASSKSGSADVLEALGVNISLNNEQAAHCLDQVGLCFMFAQVFHQSMKHAAMPRKEIGIRTVFNLLGPLTNPAGADRQLLGVFDRSKTELMAHVLRHLGLKRAMVVASHDGLDEISISAPTQVTELKNGDITTFELTPDDLGLRASGIDAIAGGDAKTNAEIILSILRGDRGPYRDVVLANAGACFYVSERCSTLQEGVKLAAAAIDSNRAYEKLQQLIQYTGELNHVS
ncbi:anthranilate phosphoribosyltransferase [Gorillibacterium sp. sgz5001074]|uniref:anthranilate phosphoribosyltransferase n=1 Tax=Gorillibacterium sp. sgz5001074 TaxID=3446695 RepID=UPI003F67E2FC